MRSKESRARLFIGDRRHTKLIFYAVLLDENRKGKKLLILLSICHSDANKKDLEKKLIDLPKDPSWQFR